jgi:hypothetical protein
MPEECFHCIAKVGKTKQQKSRTENRTGLEDMLLLRYRFRQ